MHRRGLVFLLSFLFLLPLARSNDTAPLDGFSTAGSAAERKWEEQFRAIPSPDNMRAYMQRLSARPHNVSTAYDKDNAEWILAQLEGWGLDAHIETFDVRFPTPKVRVVELVPGDRGRDGGAPLHAPGDRGGAAGDPRARQHHRRRDRREAGR